MPVVNLTDTLLFRYFILIVLKAVFTLLTCSDG